MASEIEEHLEELRQNALLRGVPYSYADLSQQLGINPEQVEDPELYRRGLEMLGGRYEPELPRQASQEEPSPLENKVGKAIKPVTQRDLDFLEKAKPYRNNPENCNLIDLVDLMQEYYPRFIVGGKQPLVLYGEKIGKGHDFNRYEKMGIITIFSKMYDFYYKKAIESGYAPSDSRQI